MTVDSPGVVVLDTACVPDVLGLRTRDDDAETVRVLPGRAREGVRVLIPDANVMVRGFHDITLLGRACTRGRFVSSATVPSRHNYVESTLNPRHGLTLFPR